MFKGLFPNAPIRFWIVTAVSLLMVLRGLVPTGYMLDRPADGSNIVIRICGGMTERFISLDPHTGNMSEIDAGEAPAAPQHDDTTSLSTTCPFATTALFNFPLLPEWFQAAIYGPPLLGSQPVINTLANWRARAPLPARGPPVRT